MENTHLIYDQPANEHAWEQALPLGNGFLGAMVFGGADKELVQLNQDSVWNGGFRQRINPDARGSLKQVRELIFAGRLSEAEEKVYTDMLSAAIELGNYEPLADLKLVFDKKIPHYSLNPGRLITKTMCGNWIWSRRFTAVPMTGILSIIKERLLYHTRIRYWHIGFRHLRQLGCA